MTSLLYSNDRPGEYPDSYYRASTEIPAVRAPLRGQATADVAVVGAGYTGLSTALHLAQAGMKVVVLDAQRAGFGASGRNGGQLGAGQRLEQPELEARFGTDAARAMWDIALDAVALVKDLVRRHGIDCDLRPGIAVVNHRRRYDDETRRLVDHMARHYDYEVEYLDPQACRALVKSPRYSAGFLDRNSAHLHPLKFALGLAAAAEAAGAVIHEESRVRSIGPGRVRTDGGEVVAREVVLACNGYLDDLHDDVARHVMPINNFIIATEPLSEAAARGILAEDIAVADSKFVVNYFRFSADRRLLFGGRESYGYRFPNDIKRFVRKAMVGIFPQTADLAIDYGWGGTLAITASRLPYLREIEPHVWNSSGYSGHGVALATMSGKLVADAIAGRRAGFDIMAQVPAVRFPGGRRMQSPLLVAAMLLATLRDRL